MELEAWIKPVNSRLRFCVCIVLFSFLTEEFFFCSTILLAHQLLACLRRSDSGKCHSPLSESLEHSLINSCFLLPLAQIPAETPLSIHDSPFPADDQDTVRRTFLAPPDPTGKVSCPQPPPPRPQFPAFPITDVTKPIGD